MEHFLSLEDCPDFVEPTLPNSRGGRAVGTRAVETRVMIFSQYRESVQEISDMLACHAPLVRVMSFVGHGTTGKSSSKGLTQREQIEVRDEGGGEVKNGKGREREGGREGERERM